jgi:hypothetical protein
MVSARSAAVGISWVDWTNNRSFGSPLKASRIGFWYSANSSFLSLGFLAFIFGVLWGKLFGSNGVWGGSFTFSDRRSLVVLILAFNSSSFFLAKALFFFFSASFCSESSREIESRFAFS